MSSPVDVKTVEVWRRHNAVGHIRRTLGGSTFRYDAALVGRTGGIAFNLPFLEREFITTGINLHPFFANLLPEGLRFTALVRKIKASPDDLLSLLIAVGAETIGDVSLVSVGTSKATPEMAPDVLENVDFEELRAIGLRPSLTGRIKREMGKRANRLRTA